MIGRMPPEIEDLAQEIGQFMEYWGFKKVHGQIWCHLFLSTNGLDASDLMARLGVSKALVSISLKELQEFQVIEEAGKSERGTRVYCAKPDIVTPIVETIRRRERRMLSRMQAAHSLLEGLPETEKDEVDLNWERVRYLGQLIELASQGLENVIKKKWHMLGDLLYLKKKVSEAQRSLQ